MMKDGLMVDQDPLVFRQVVAEALEEIIAENRGRRVAVVCHGGVINAWTSYVLGMEKVLFFQPTYTSINRFAAAGSGERSVLSLNEAAHLRGLEAGAAE
jgi:probable phosphoglycerate mutase